MPDGTATAHLYRPKLVTAFGEGYGLDKLRNDIVAGLTVAVVVLPLSMAIGVAPGVAPERGVYTSNIGGFLVSALGGSRYQIGGPAGAFIVLVAATGAKFGLQGLLLTVLVSGLMLALVGALKLGSLIRHILHAVTVGFTSGIAITILTSQIKDWGAFTLAGPEPGPLLLWQILPSAFSFTLLAGVESLLSAKVADSMTGRRHRSNMELVAQGIANIASAIFGGISVTGTIARTATNIRAGAKSPMSGIMRSAFVLLFLLVAAPLSRFIPLSSLAGVLVVAGTWRKKGSSDTYWRIGAPPWCCFRRSFSRW